MVNGDINEIIDNKIDVIRQELHVLLVNHDFLDKEVLKKSQELDKWTSLWYSFN